MFSKTLPLESYNHNFLHSGLMSAQEIIDVSNDINSDTVTNATTEKITQPSQDSWMETWEDFCCAVAMFVILSIITALEWYGLVHVIR